MPKFDVRNALNRSYPIRTADRGIVRIAAGATETVELAPSIARYYDSVSHIIATPAEGEDASAMDAGNKGPRPLTELSTAELTAIGEKEGVDLTTATTDEDRVDLINRFRAIWNLGDKDTVKGEAARRDIDDNGTKTEIVNRMVAAERVAQ